MSRMRVGVRSDNFVSENHPASGFAAVGIFLFFGATMASLAAITLLWRGTSLDRIWSLNPAAYGQEEQPPALAMAAAVTNSRRLTFFTAISV